MLEDNIIINSVFIEDSLKTIILSMNGLSDVVLQGLGGMS